MLAIIVRVRVKPGDEERFLARVREQAQASLADEPACRRFDVCRDPADAGEVFLYELYETEADFAAHLRSAHFLAFDADTRAWVDQKDVKRLVRLGPED